jgi:hypothetical protein
MHMTFTSCEPFALLGCTACFALLGCTVYSLFCVFPVQVQIIQIDQRHLSETPSF